MQNLEFSPELMDELYDSIEDSEIKELGIEVEQERIFTVEQANFYLRQLAKLKEEKEAINSMCDNEIQKFSDRVNAFREEKINVIANTEEWISKMLKGYAETELAESGKKTLKLPFGTLSFKKAQDKYDYEDKVVLQFLEENNHKDLINVKTTESIDKKALKSTAKVIDGKLFIDEVEVPGVSVTTGEVNFNVKL